MPSSKQDFQNHLAQIGFDFSRNPTAILQRLRGRMGEERFGRYLLIVNTVHDGDSYNQIYDFMNDLIEANLLRSMSPDVTLDASFRLYERCFAYLRPGTRVLELGCWTGGLCSFVAANHPACTVMAVDRAQRIIEQDRAHYSLPNLSFRVWDYRQPPPADLPQADLLMCSLGININTPPGAYTELDPVNVRAAPAYRAEREELTPYFANWRSAAREGARLLAVLRIGSFPRFLAVLDAARGGGWKVHLEESESVVSMGSELPLPLLSFIAARGEEIDEILALSYWMRLLQNTHHLVSLSAGVALGMYRSLGPKQILATRAFTTEAGHSAREEIGRAGAFGYIYTQDAAPSHRLDLLTLSAIEQRAKAAGGGQSHVPLPI